MVSVTLLYSTLAPSGESSCPWANHRLAWASVVHMLGPLSRPVPSHPDWRPTLRTETSPRGACLAAWCQACSPGLSQYCESSCSCSSQSAINHTSNEQQPSDRLLYGPRRQKAREGEEALTAWLPAASQSLVSGRDHPSTRTRTRTSLIRTWWQIQEPPRFSPGFDQHVWLREKQAARSDQLASRSPSYLLVLTQTAETRNKSSQVFVLFNRLRRSAGQQAERCALTGFQPPQVSAGDQGYVTVVFKEKKSTKIWL